MINIITVGFSETSGPAKVVQNLLKGLKKINYPYIINKDINSTKRCYIPNRRSALVKIGKATSNIIVGPNLYVLPHEISRFTNLEETIYLQPSQWVADLWKFLGFDQVTVKVWPTGIDTDSFYPMRSSNKRITVYHKKRSRKELEHIERTLMKSNVNFVTIRSGNYNEEEYKEILRHTSFIIWHGCHESQGIALQEALASGVPILVCDVQSLFDETGGYPWPGSLSGFQVTTVPYFDERCGVKIDDLGKLRSSVEFMMDSLRVFRPREFILENLSLQKQALELIKLYEYFGLKTEDGFAETTLNSRRFESSAIARVGESVLKQLNTFPGGRSLKMSFRRHIIKRYLCHY